MLKDWKQKNNIYGNAWSNQESMKKKGEFRNYKEVFYTRKKNKDGKFVSVIYEHPSLDIEREEFDSQEEAKNFIKQYMRKH